MYADATTEEQEYDAITTLYNDLVIGVIDKASQVFKERIIQLGQLGNNVGPYNSSNIKRTDVLNRLSNEIPGLVSPIYGLVTQADLLWGDVNGRPAEIPMFAAEGAKFYATESDKEPNDADIFLIMRALTKGAKIDLITRNRDTRYPTVKVNRISWLEDKGTPKRKSDENRISLFDIPAYALHLKIVDEIIANVPPKFRPEVKIPVIGPNGQNDHITRVHYPLLGLKPELAYKLIYSHGINYSPASLDYNPGRLATDGSGRPKRLLTPSQALDGILHRVKGFFDLKPKSRETSIQNLLTRRSFISIEEADFTQNVGYHIATTADSTTVFLFPDAQPPQLMDQSGRVIMSADSLISRPDLVFDLLLYSVGFRITTTNITQDKIQASIKGLYNVFSEVLDIQIPTVIQYNSIPIGRSSGHNYLSNGDSSNFVRYIPVRGTLKVRNATAAVNSILMPNQQAPAPVPVAPVAPGATNVHHHLGNQDMPAAHYPSHLAQTPGQVNMGESL